MADPLLSFIEQDWQGIVSVLALLVAIYAWRMARRTFRMEYDAREVRVDFVAEQVRVSSDNAGQNRDVQLFNDTGSSQLVRDLWIRVADFPADISDEQADRLATIMQAFTDATHGLMSRPDVCQPIRGLSSKPEFARHWFPRLVAKLLNIYDKVVKGSKKASPTNGKLGPLCYYPPILTRKEASAVGSRATGYVEVRRRLPAMGRSEAQTPEDSLGGGDQIET